MAPLGGTSIGASGPLATTLAILSIGTLQFGAAISLAAFIFAGPLAGGAGKAAVAFILATVVLSIAVGLRSRMSTVIAGTQDTAAIVAAVIAASIAGSASPEGQVPTVLAMLAIAGVGSGLAMWFIGRFGYASVVRFLPYPVVSGFMAGTGWLLMRGGIEVMLGRAVHFADVPDLFAWSSFKFLAIGLGLASFMLLCVVRGISSVAISAAILISSFAFHAIGRRVSSLDALEQEGWLIGPFSQSASWPPLRPSDISAIDWGVLGENALSISVIVIVSIIGLMLNLSGLEGVLDEDIDVDHEMQVAGAANVLSGLGSGLISYHLIGDTTLARQLGVRSRAIAIAIGVLGLGLLIVGADLVALMPRAVAGGVLFGLGLNLLFEWATGSFARMNRADRMISGLILAVIATVGILTGVGAGLLLAVAIFVFRYSRTDPVRYALRAAGRSNVDRRPENRAFLVADPSRIIAIELQGYLFFGSVRRLRATIEQQLAEVGGSVAGVRRFIVFDFARVTGLDSTAATSMGSSLRRLADLNVVAVWSALPPSIRAELDLNGVDTNNEFRDLDHAIAWAEDAMLEDFGTDACLTDVRVSAPGATAAPLDTYPREIRERMHCRTISSGETLVAANDGGNDLFFIAAGVLTAWTAREDGQAVRLRRLSEGSIVGEVSFCTGAPRTATVVADTDATVHVLTRQAFEDLVRTEPEAAIELQELLLERLADRLSSTSAMVRDLLH